MALRFTQIKTFLDMEDNITPYYDFSGERLYDILKRFRPLYEEETYEALYQYNGDISREETIMEIVDSMMYIGAILSTINRKIKPIREEVLKEYQKYVVSTRQEFDYNNLLKDWVVQVNGIYVYDILRIFNERKYHKKGDNDFTIDEKVDIVMKNFVKMFAKTVSVLMIILTDKRSNTNMHELDVLINLKYNKILRKAKKNGRFR